MLIYEVFEKNVIVWWLCVDVIFFSMVWKVIEMVKNLIVKKMKKRRWSWKGYNRKSVLVMFGVFLGFFVEKLCFGLLCWFIMNVVSCVEENIVLEIRKEYR